MKLTSYFTSNDIIDAVKRKIAVPISQNTFGESDILAFANDEMAISQVPSVMQYHEEHFVHTIDQELEYGRKRYPIPDRAIGGKLRDIMFVDLQGNEFALTQILTDDRTVFGDNYNVGNIHKFYFENDEVVLVIGDNAALTGKLRMSIFLRPNQLVPFERAAFSTNFVKQLTLDNDNINDGETFSINKKVFTVGVEFVKGLTSIETASNLVSAINYSKVANAVNGTPSTSTVSIKFPDIKYTFSTDSLGIAISSYEGVEVGTMPTNFSDDMSVDFLQTKSGHKTYKYGVKLTTNSISDRVIYFKNNQIPRDFRVGDYICSEYECVIPQIPDDLHIALIERTCHQMLTAMGDLQGAESSNSKIKEIDYRQGTLIDNRAEGAPLKVNNLHSPMRYGKRGRFLRRY